MRRGLVALTVALALWWALRGRSHGAPDEPRATPVVASAAPSVAPRSGVNSTRQEARPTPPPSPRARADDPGPGPWIALYHGRSGALGSQTRPDDGEAPTVLRSTGPAPVLEAWASSTRIDAGADVTLFARVREAPPQRVSVRSAAVYVFARGASERGESASMQPAAGALRAEFQHVFRAPREVSSRAPPRAFDYAVRVEGSCDGAAFERVVLGGFSVHAPGATIDARSLTATRDGGDLAVTVRANVTTAATYGLYAELWRADGDVPIAFARERFDALSEGAHEVAVRFGGQILRDRGIDGPYVIRNVRWSSGATIPPHEQRPAGPLSTPAWRADDFW